MDKSFKSKDKTILMKTLFFDKTKTIGDYKLLSIIGRGKFSKVWKAEHQKTKKIYAIKVLDKKRINKNKRSKELFKVEISIMKDIKHKNIIHLYKFLESEKHYYLVTDYCNQGDLSNYLKNTKKNTSTKKKRSIF